MATSNAGWSARAYNLTQMCYGYEAIGYSDGLVRVTRRGMATQALSRVSGIVLAGGQSQRMGRNKALMTLGGQTLISRVLGRLTRLCDELIISTNDVGLYAGLTARVVPDVIPDKGALSGVHAALLAMRHDRAIVTACDMPFLSIPLLRYMVVLAQEYDVVVPWVGGYYEPLQAVYSASCVTAIEETIARGPQRVAALFDHVRVRNVTEDEVKLFGAHASFVNLNSPRDWAEAQRLLEEGF